MEPSQSCSFGVYSLVYVVVLILITMCSLLVAFITFRQLVQVNRGFSILDPEVSLFSSGMRVRKYFIHTTIVVNAIQFIAGFVELVGWLSTYKTQCGEEEVAKVMSLDGDNVMSNVILACRLIPSTFYMLLFALLTCYFVHICLSLKVVTLVIIGGKYIGDAGIVILFFSLIGLGSLIVYSVFAPNKDILFLAAWVASFMLLCNTLWYCSKIRRYIKTSNFLANSARLTERMYLVMIIDIVSVLLISVFYFSQYFRPEVFRTFYWQATVQLTTMLICGVLSSSLIIGLLTNSFTGVALPWHIGPNNPTNDGAGFAEAPGRSPNWTTKSLLGSARKGRGSFAFGSNPLFGSGSGSGSISVYNNYQSVSQFESPTGL